jgi:signal transduction histidine kinase
MDQEQQAGAELAPQTLEQALALLARRDAQLAALRSEQQAWVHAVSHDLRAPLRHVLAFNPLIAELLQSPHPGAEELEEALGFLHTMDQSAQRMAAMFDGLLQLARATRQALSWQAVDLAPLLHSLKQQLESAAPGRNIVWRLPEACPVVQADPQLLEQALRAALSNALKFSRSVPQACIQVGVSLSDDGLAIAVSDNGVGFDEARADRLFGIFQRMHREAEFEGAGTGLALVRSICRRHGGEASIHGQNGLGCELRLGWPQPR